MSFRLLDGWHLASYGQGSWQRGSGVSSITNVQAEPLPSIGPSSDNESMSDQTQTLRPRAGSA